MRAAHRLVRYKPGSRATGTRTDDRDYLGSKAPAANPRGVPRAPPPGEDVLERCRTILFVVPSNSHSRAGTLPNHGKVIFDESYARPRPGSTVGFASDA